MIEKREKNDRILLLIESIFIVFIKFKETNLNQNLTK